MNNSESNLELLTPELRLAIDNRRQQALLIRRARAEAERKAVLEPETPSLLSITPVAQVAETKENMLSESNLEPLTLEQQLAIDDRRQQALRIRYIRAEAEKRRSTVLEPEKRPRLSNTPVAQVAETEETVLQIRREAERQERRKQLQQQLISQKNKFDESYKKLTFLPKEESSLEEKKLSEEAGQIEEKFRNLALFAYNELYISTVNKEKQEKSEEVLQPVEGIVQERLRAITSNIPTTNGGPVSNYYHVEHSFALYRGKTRELVRKVLAIRKKEGLLTGSNVAAVRLSFEGYPPILEGSLSRGAQSKWHAERIALCIVINQAIDKNRPGFEKLSKLDENTMILKKNRNGEFFLPDYLLPYKYALIDHCSNVEIYSDLGACTYSVSMHEDAICVDFFSFILPRNAWFFFGIPYFRGAMGDNVHATLRKQIGLANDCIDWENNYIYNKVMQRLNNLKESLVPRNNSDRDISSSITSERSVLATGRTLISDVPEPSLGLMKERDASSLSHNNVSVTLFSSNTFFSSSSNSSSSLSSDFRFSSSAPNIYYGSFNGEDVVFEEDNLAANESGDCGFLGLGISREEAVKSLLDNKDKQNIRKLVAPEIMAASVEGELPDSLVQDQTMQTLLKNFYENDKGDQESKTDNSARDKLLDYCTTLVVYEAFIKGYLGKKGWLTYNGNVDVKQSSSIDALANLMQIRVYIWQKISEFSKKVYIAHNSETSDVRNTIHLLHTAGGTHYNILSRKMTPITGLASASQITKNLNGLPVIGQASRASSVNSALKPFASFANFKEESKQSIMTVFAHPFSRNPDAEAVPSAHVQQLSDSDSFEECSLPHPNEFSDVSQPKR